MISCLLAVLLLVQCRMLLTFSCQGALLVHTRLALYRDSQVLFHRAALQPASVHPVLWPGFLPANDQDFAFVLAAFHKVPVGLFLQRV